MSLLPSARENIRNETETLDMTDDLIMLLSTDWFLPYWAEIQINMAEDKKIGIQQGCREIVTQILGGAENLSLSDFSEERKRETRSKFLALLRAWNAEKEMSTTYQEWATLSHQELNAAWTCAYLNRKLSSGDVPTGIPDLGHQLRAEVLKAWEKYALKSSLYRDTCLNSSTEWDVQTRTALGRPGSLASQLQRVLLDHRLREFWEHLRQVLTESQVRELVSWYEAMVKSMSHDDRPDLIPPYIS